MGVLNFSKISGKILVIGSIYDQFSKITNNKLDMDDYELVIVNGNLCYPFDDLSSVKNRISLMQELELKRKYIYNLGAYDLKLLQILSEDLGNKDVKNWIKSKPNIIKVNFINQTSIIIVNGGLPCKLPTECSLTDNIEVSFMSYIDDKPWQNYYSGQLGYVISNYPLSNDPPHFYPYALQMGMKYCADTPVYAQEADQYGLKNTILL